MNIQGYLSLAAVGLLSVLASAGFSVLIKKGRMDALSYRSRQIIIGLVFGAIASCATEFGVPYRDTIINVRDAAPICAGLIFGAPAGIIAGTVGAAERWFAVYWGVGRFTRTGCTVGTFLAGLAAAGVRRYMFDDRIPLARHSLLISVVVEVIHMMLIFLTNLSSVKYAFRYVRVCTAPMVVANAAAVMIAIYLVRRVGRVPGETEEEEKFPTISTLFHARLLWIVMITFFLTTGFTYVIQNGISEQSTIGQFDQTVQDVSEDLMNKCDDDLLTLNYEIADEIASAAAPDLKQLALDHDVYAVTLIGKGGKIIDSSLADHIGKEINDLYDFPLQYIALLDPRSKGSFVTQLGPVKFSGGQRLRESVIRSGDILVQVFLDEERANRLIGSALPEMIMNRHIGEDGGLIALDQDGNVLCSTDGLLFDAEHDAPIDFSMDVGSLKERTLGKCMIGDAENYCMRTKVGDHDIISVIPVAEADFSKEMAVLLNFFLLMVVFGTLFVMIYISIKNLIAGNIHKVNDSLSEITAGNLDTVVDVRSAKEFIELSDDINSTVGTLKRYIAEANARIDTELQYARDIQSSALPSIFPDREEIDMFALMDPAKQVGGDFYDYYFLGKNKIVFLVADVSGKGIPASLFMMRAKTIMKTYAEYRIAVADIFTNANYQLCEGNETSMFVTAWMGILDLETGKLTYVNAGHNPPLVRRKDGPFEYLRDRSGFVLGALEGITYKEKSLILEPGDEIFLYTDGVVEATNAEEQLYGDERLRDFLNGLPEESAKEVCTDVWDDVDRFYDGAPQFDDITELSLKFIRYAERNRS